tara:strand:+ start:411 stop:752 length:342 start_codon:yes stop_codon:yes gene_type:complete
MQSIIIYQLLKLSEGIRLCNIMPKYVVSPLIAEGQYEFILRINLTPAAQGKCDGYGDKQIFSGGIFYIVYVCSKNEYKLADVEKKRYDLLVFYEKLGFRGVKAIKSTKFKQIL